MLPEYLRGARIGILGFGVNHQSLVRWLVAQGATDIVVYDESEATAERIAEQGLAVEQVLGPGAFDEVDAEVLFRSPGIAPDRPELVAAAERGIIITSQTKLFFELCPAKIVGVTGTKGKSTTSSLIAAMLTQGIADGQVYLAGNIGRDPFDFLDTLIPADWVVLELSSFQLVDLNRGPHIAVVLGIASDHLEYHKTQAAYVAAKLPIVATQTRKDYAVLNLEDATSLSFADQTLAQVRYYATNAPVDQGVCVVGDAFVWRSEAGDETVAAVGDLGLRGWHNVSNAAAAITAAKLAGCPNEAIIHGLRSFAGLPHRLQLVHEAAGIAWYNDSIATNPSAATAALQSFLEPIILIAGGSDKGLDYAEFGQSICQTNVKRLIVIGQTGPAIAEQAEYHDYPTDRIVLAGTLDAAVREARAAAEPGDVVLLAPASASFDQFPNYKVRGEQFAALAKASE